jgi:hypothetical protein
MINTEWPPLWSSGQSSWLQMRRSGFDSRRYHIFWKVVGLERGPLSLVSTIKELLERKSSGSGLQSREYGRRIRHADHVPPLYLQKLALTSLTSGGRSIGIIRLRTQAMEFSLEKRWLIRDRFRVSHRRPGRKDIRFGSTISLPLSHNFALLKYLFFY